MKLLKIILFALLVLSIFAALSFINYLFGALIAYDYNIANWDMVVRALIALIEIFIIFSNFVFWSYGYMKAKMESDHEKMSADYKKRRDEFNKQFMPDRKERIRKL